jgi:hypothetical protein
MQGPRAAGLNRVFWDLRDTPSKRVTYRTTPLFAPEIRVGADGIRESEGFGGGGGGLAIMQPPGTYTVKLSAGGRDYTQQLRVLKDPHSAGTEADIAAQQQMLTLLRRDLDEAVDAVNSAELVRAQIVNLKNLIQDAELQKAADELDQKLIAAEGTLVELRTTGAAGRRALRLEAGAESSATWRTVSQRRLQADESAGGRPPGSEDRFKRSQGSSMTCSAASSPRSTTCCVAGIFPSS